MHKKKSRLNCFGRDFFVLVKGRHKPHPQQKAPPTEGKVSTGLAGMSLFRNGQKAAQSSALSSRLPSFLACSTTAGTSISGRIS